MLDIAYPPHVLVFQAGLVAGFIDSIAAIGSQQVQQRTPTFVCWFLVASVALTALRMLLEGFRGGGAAG